MNQEFAVSIITPTFNSDRFLADAIKSVQKQVFNNWEMIIVDDCSSDKTTEIAESFAKNDKRIRLFKNLHNSGPAGTRNKALLEARHRFVAFLDSDDMWLPAKLDRQVSFMLRKNSAFSFTEYRRISVLGNKQGRIIRIPKLVRYDDLLKNTVIATSSVVIDKTRVGDFFMKETYYDDFVLWLDILKRGFLAHGLKEDLMRYRVVGGSISRNKVASAKYVWSTYREDEGLSVIYSTWCFINYALNAFLKYIIF
ncbi:MAG: glycosyltransferase family 2 protein [Candidatus Omnitrophica bacterium]|nr:glycosyltransferase family 2 protein [Candidatus Omnitrophota bacterium]